METSSSRGQILGELPRGCDAVCPGPFSWRPGREARFPPRPYYAGPSRTPLLERPGWPRPSPSFVPRPATPHSPALNRHRLGTRKQRFGVLEQHLGAASWSSILEQHSAARAGLLSERTKRNPEKARATPSRAHIEADEPGELVGFECFYIGKLKIGKLKIGKLKIGKLKGVGKSGRSRPVIRPEGLAILWSFASSLSALPGRRSAPHLAWRAQLKVIFRGPAWQARPRRVDSSDPKAGCAALKSPATSPAFDHEFADPVGKVALSLPWILSPRVG